MVLGILALTDPGADAETRLDGAMLVAGLARDIRLIRQALTGGKGD